MAVTLETGLDTVSNVLEILVLEYGAQLKPYAIQLCSQLVNQLAVLIQHDGDEDIDEMEDKSMAAIGVLNALSALVKSLESNYAILSSLETIILPALQYIFTHACMDLMEESFDLVLEILHCSKSVSVTMWNLFPCLHQNLKVYALDYFEQAYPILQYFASHGESGLAQNDQVKSQLLELALLILKDHDCRDEEKACSCVLIETIMQRAKGTIDQVYSINLAIDTHTGICDSTISR